MANRCADCGSSRIRDVHGDQTCIDCGRVMEGCPLVASDRDWERCVAPNRAVDALSAVMRHTLESMFADVDNAPLDAIATHLEKERGAWKGVDPRIAIAVSYYLISDKHMSIQELALRFGLHSSPMITLLRRYSVPTRATENHTPLLRDVVPRFLNRLLKALRLYSNMLFQQLLHTCENIWQRVIQVREPAHQHTSLAACLIYMACRVRGVELATVKTVAMVCGIASATVTYVENSLKQILQT